MTPPKIFSMAFAKVYPLYLQKIEKKERTKTELDQVIIWLTGYTQAQLEAQIQSDTDFETFFGQAPGINPHTTKITGVICGHRIEDLEPGLMKNIRFLDKLVDELAQGKSLDKILRD